jgi:hypothetical protein
MNKFLHITVAFAEVPKIKELEPAITTVCDDWLRYSATTWIIWTGRSANDIAMHLRAYLAPNDQFYIVKIDLSEQQGWLPKWIWDWLNKNRQPSLPGLGQIPPQNPFYPPPGGIGP